MKNNFDRATINSIIYRVDVGCLSFEFDDGREALSFAKNCRISCTDAKWNGDPEEVTIHLMPVLDNPEEPEVVEESEEEIHCDEQLEKECEA